MLLIRWHIISRLLLLLPLVHLVQLHTIHWASTELTLARLYILHMAVLQHLVTILQHTTRTKVHMQHILE